MKAITLTFNLTDELGLKSIVFDYNDTGLPENSETLRKIAIATLKAISDNQESCGVQDLLNDLDIPRQK